MPIALPGIRSTADEASSGARGIDPLYGLPTAGDGDEDSFVPEAVVPNSTLETTANSHSYEGRHTTRRMGNDVCNV